MTQTDPASKQQIYISSVNGQPVAEFGTGYNTPFGYQKTDYAGLGQHALSLLEYYKSQMDRFKSRGSDVDYNRVLQQYNDYGGDAAYNALKSGSYDVNILSKVFPQLDKNQLSSFSQGQSVDSGYVTDPKTGNLTKQSAIDQEAFYAAEVAAGRMKKVPIGAGFGYVPTGSAGDANLVNIGTHNTAVDNTRPSVSGGPSGISQPLDNTRPPISGGPSGISQPLNGVQFNEDQALADIYAQRPDLQELYGTDGRAINPNDPRVAGIPTILDWARQYGVKEYPILQGASFGNPPVPGGSSGISNPLGNFESTGDAALDAILGQMQGYIETLQQQGQQFNPNIELTPAIVKQFLDQATAEIEPFYANQIKAIKTELTRNLDDLEKSYQLQKEDTAAEFKTGLENKRESLSGAGLAFSGVRGQQEQAVTGGAQRTFDQLALNASSKAAGAILDSETKIGSRNLSDIKLPNLQEYSVSNSGSGAITPTRSLNFGLTGGITGDVEYNKARDIRNLTDYFKQQEIQKRTLNF